MADYQNAFNMYLGTLENRTKMEADTYVQKQVAQKQIVQNLFTAGADVINKIQNDNVMKGQYQAMAKQTGELDKWRSVTPNEESLMQQHATVLNAINRNENRMKSNLEDVNSKIPYESDPSKVKDIIEKPVAEYKKNQSILSSQLSDIENRLSSYKKSPAYQIDSDETAFNNLFTHAKLNSAKYYEVMGGASVLAKNITPQQRADIEVKKQKEIYDYKTAGDKNQKVAGMVDKLRGMSTDIDSQFIDDGLKYSVKKKIADGIQKLGTASDPDKYYADLNADILKTLNPQKTPPPAVETRQQKHDRMKKEDAIAKQEKLKAMSDIINKAVTK